MISFRLRFELARVLVLATFLFGAATVSLLQAEEPQPPSIASQAPLTSGQPRKRLHGWPIAEIYEWPDGKRTSEYFFSLYQHTKSSDGFSTRLVPFYWAGSSREEDHSYFLLLPFAWHERSGNSYHTWNPLWYASRADSGVQTLVLPGLLPVYLKKSGSAFSAQAFTAQSAGVPFVFSIASAYASPGKQSLAVGSLFPFGNPGEYPLSLFRYRTRTNGESTKSHLFPLYYYQRRGPADSPRSQVVCVPPLLWFSSWTPEFSLKVWLPLLGGAVREQKASTWFALLGLAGGTAREHQSEKVRSYWFEPLFSNLGDDTEGSFHVAHLFGRSWDTARDEHSYRFIDPLIAFNYRGDELRHARVFPLYMMQKERKEAWTWAGLLYFSHRSNEPGESVQSAETAGPAVPNLSGHDFATLFPIYWRSRAYGSEFHAFLPFYAGVRDKNDAYDFLLGPLYVRQKSLDGSGAVAHSFLWPFYEYSYGPDRWHLRAPPLLWLTHREQSAFDLVFPFYLRLANPQTSSVWVLPVWGKHDTTDEAGERSVFSFYVFGALIRGQRTSAAGDLLKRELHFLGPLAGYSENRRKGSGHSRVFPFWYGSYTPTQERKLLFPLYYSQSNAASRSSLTSVLGPLWIDREVAERRERGVLWPLTSYATGNDKSSLRITPLFGMRSRDADVRSFRLTPLVYLKECSGRSSEMEVLHLYSHQRFGTDGSATRVMPFLYYRERRGDWQSTMLGPMLFTHTSDSGYSDTQFLLFGYERRESPAYGRFSIFPLGYTQWLEEPRSRINSWLFGALYSESSEGRKQQRIFPLWKYENTERGNYEVGVSPLFHYEQFALGSTPRGVWSTDGFFGLQLLRYAHGDEGSTSCLNPFLFGSHRAQEKVDWSTLCSLASGSSAPGHSRWQFLQLARYRKNDHLTRWCVLPFAYSENQRDSALPSFKPIEIMNLYYRGEDSGESRWRLLGVLANGSSSKQNGDYDFRILHRFVQATRNRGYSEFSIRPLFTREENSRTGYSYTSLLSFLYRAERENSAAPVKRRVLWFIPI